MLELWDSDGLARGGNWIAHVNRADANAGEPDDFTIVNVIVNLDANHRIDADLLSAS